ncbi:hypothetical protein ACFLWO_04715 [Chloroflexota bacterium]
MKPEMVDTDFWWLSPNQKEEYIHINLCHHTPICDDDDLRWEVSNCSTLDLDSWRAQFHNSNVYRSLLVTKTLQKNKQLAGPLVVDIDNEHNLEDTLLVTRKAIYIFENLFEITRDNIRTFFTGRKGFNIEVHPETINIRGSVDEQLQISASILHQITTRLRNGYSFPVTNQVSEAETFIDQIYGSRRSGYEWKHPFLGLHDSLNSWLMIDGTPKERANENRD